MRHAKAAWTSDDSDDHARPLDERGRRDAPRIAARLVEIGWLPDIVISSDSERTRQTLELMHACLRDTRSTTFTRDLYLAGVDEAVRALAKTEDDTACVLLLGHNPGWEDVLMWLSRERSGLGTANAALLECAASTWAESIAREGDWSLKEILRPS